MAGPISARVARSYRDKIPNSTDETSVCLVVGSFDKIISVKLEVRKIAINKEKSCNYSFSTYVSDLLRPTDCFATPIDRWDSRSSENSNAID